MSFKEGNNYWEHREKHGRDYKYTPEKLWEEAILYFQWAKDNPLMESVFVQKGIVIKDEQGNRKTVYEYPMPKMRAMTLKAFHLFADIGHSTWEGYKKIDDFSTITTRIQSIIYSQKFEGAAASMLNPNIIARDLGLKEHTSNTNTNVDLTPLTKEERDEAKRKMDEDY